jgi:hypothetical protein
MYALTQIIDELTKIRYADLDRNYNKFALQAPEKEIQCKICISSKDNNKKWVNINFEIFNISSAEMRNDIVEVLKKDSRDIYMSLNSISNLIHSQKKRQEYSLSSNALISLQKSQ